MGQLLGPMGIPMQSPRQYKGCSQGKGLTGVLGGDGVVWPLWKACLNCKDSMPNACSAETSAGELMSMGIRWGWQELGQGQWSTGFLLERHA